ncbi:hypothetical protein BMS3Bbin02_01199 [bacterium BMS3Bbin02]|nr:hypothetical protein BMS3Bbin02_01199 [bacterium BMS3Bbin02]
MSPGNGVALLDVFVIAISTRGTLSCALAELLPGTGSTRSLLSTDAVLIMSDPAVPASTVATIVSVADSPDARAPTVHVGPRYEPAVAEDDTSVSPPGSASVIATPVVASGPLLTTVTV